MTSSSTPATSAPSNWAQVARGNHSPPPHAINKYELSLSNGDHIARYDSIASRKIIEPKTHGCRFLENC